MAILIEIKKNGEVILLDNGIKYSVNPSDIPVCCIRTPTAEVKVEKVSNENTYNYRLTNEEIDVSISAMKIN